MPSTRSCSLANGRLAAIEDGTLCLTPSPRPGATGGAAAAVFQVHSMSLTDRLVTAARLAIPHVPVDMRQQFAAMFTPEAVATTGAVLTAWAVSHAYGVGEAVDLILAGVGALVLGHAAIEAARDLYRFIRLASSASDMPQLEAAGQCLARAVAVIGVNTLLVLLAKGAKTAKSGAGAAEAGPLASRGAAVPVLSSEALAFLESERTAAQSGLAIEARRAEVLEEWYRNFSKHNHDYPLSNVEIDGPKTSFERLASEIKKGSDLSQKILRVDFFPGDELIQYARAGGQIGVYVARPGATADSLAVKGYRILARFRVKERFYAIESTAKPFDAKGVPDVGGSGGGQQFLMPPHWESFVQRILFSGRP